MRHRILRAVTFLVIFFFAWTMGGMFNIAYAAYNEIQKPAANQKQSLKPEEKFQKAVDDLRDVISKKASLSNKRSELKEKRKTIESLDVEIKSQFVETEKKLKNAGLPQEILQRHYNFVKHYEDNLKELRANLDAADNAKTDTEFTTNAEKIRKHLEKTFPPRKHKPLDPNKLPHRISNLKRKEPRTRPEEFQKDIKQTASVVIPAKAGIQTTTAPVSLRGDSQAPWQSGNQPLLLASNGTLSGIVESLPKYEKQQSSPQPLVLALAHDTPTSDYLAETVDVQLTSAIRAKAAELNYSPVKIYNWVRNNVEYVPTYGSIQGADMCLQTLQGNDFDIASLLIALLRASNIHARYVYGTIELPINKVMNWVGGFTNAQAALDFIASGGTPVAGGISGGKISSVRMEHVWVEAFVKYYPLRGAKHITGQGDSWIPLDASFKQYNYTQGIDIKSAVPFDAQTFVNQIQSTATIDTTNSSVTNINSNYIQQQMQNYQNQVKAYIEQNYPDATVGEVLGKKEIIKQNFSFLAGTLPYQKSTIGVKYSEIPDSLRHKIKVELVNADTFGSVGISYISNLSQLAGKRFTLSYEPATSTDQDTISKYIKQYATSIPAYLIQLKPVLRIENFIVASGTTVGMGNAQNLNITFIAPNDSENVTHDLMAGDYAAIGLNPARISLETLQNRINENDFSLPVAEMLHQTALSYWAEVDAFNNSIAKSMKINALRHPSELVVKSKITIVYSFGVPFSATYKSRNIDVSHSVLSVISPSNDKAKTILYMQQSGIMTSFLEGAIFDQLFGKDIGTGASAVTILQSANAQGIPIYTINAANIAAILPMLQISADIKTEISNAINAGLSVQVPKTNVSHNGWTGVGYIISNANDGSGRYKISSGLDGGDDDVRAEAVYPIPQVPATGKSGFMMGILATSLDVSLSVSGGVIEGVLIGTNPLGWVVIGALAIALIIILAKSISDACKNNPPEDWRILRHYCSYEKLAYIITLHAIPMSYEKDPDNPILELGEGAYLTTLMLTPDGGGPVSLEIATILGMPPPPLPPDANLAATYVELKVDWNIHGPFFTVGKNIRGADQYRYFAPLIIDDTTVVQLYP